MWREGAVCEWRRLRTGCTCQGAFWSGRAWDALGHASDPTLKALPRHQQWQGEGRPRTPAIAAAKFSGHVARECAWDGVGARTPWRLQPASPGAAENESRSSRASRRSRNLSREKLPGKTVLLRPGIRETKTHCGPNHQTDEQRSANLRKTDTQTRGSQGTLSAAAACRWCAEGCARSRETLRS